MALHELIGEADLVVPEQLGRFVREVRLVSSVNGRATFPRRGLDEEERRPAARDRQRHPIGLRAGPPGHDRHRRPAGGIGDRVGKAVAVAAAGLEAAEVPALAFRGVVESGGDVEHLEAHRIGHERRRRVW